METASVDIRKLNERIAQMVEALHQLRSPARFASLPTDGQQWAQPFPWGNPIVPWAWAPWAPIPEADVDVM